MVIEEEEEKCRSDNDGEGVTVEWQTEETRNCVATSDEAPGTMNTTPLCTTPQGAVFGAPIQTQEQSMQLPYPVDDLVRIHPKLFADPYDLAAMITLYVECLPSRLVEGMEVWRSALATLPRNGETDLCMPETSVDLVLQSSEEVTCLYCCRCCNCIIFMIVRPSISTMTTVCPTAAAVGAGTVTCAGVYSASRLALHLPTLSSPPPPEPSVKTKSRRSETGRPQVDDSDGSSPWRSTPHPLIHTTNDQDFHQHNRDLEADTAEAAPGPAANAWLGSHTVVWEMQ
ncbi:hypothetical protein SprV_0602190500 [Sparganum proliferum]